MKLMDLTQETVMTLGTLGTLMLDSRTIEQMNLTQETVMTLGRLILDYLLYDLLSNDDNDGTHVATNIYFHSTKCNCGN